MGSVHFARALRKCEIWLCEAVDCAFERRETLEQQPGSVAVDRTSPVAPMRGSWPLRSEPLRVSTRGSTSCSAHVNPEAVGAQVPPSSGPGGACSIGPRGASSARAGLASLVSSRWRATRLSAVYRERLGSCAIKADCGAAARFRGLFAAAVGVVSAARADLAPEPCTAFFSRRFCVLRAVRACSSTGAMATALAFGRTGGTGAFLALWILLRGLVVFEAASASASSVSLLAARIAAVAAAAAASSAIGFQRPLSSGSLGVSEPSSSSRPLFCVPLYAAAADGASARGEMLGSAPCESFDSRVERFFSGEIWGELGLVEGGSGAHGQAAATSGAG
eukprot:6174879-Pleurochrysis_carterae.AAC.1